MTMKRILLIASIAIGMTSCEKQESDYPCYYNVRCNDCSVTYTAEGKTLTKTVTGATEIRFRAWAEEPISIRATNVDPLDMSMVYVGFTVYDWDNSPSVVKNEGVNTATINGSVPRQDDRKIGPWYTDSKRKKSSGHW
jgi:hypothetical protein